MPNLSNCKTLKREREYDYIVKLELKSMECMWKKTERLQLKESSNYINIKQLIIIIPLIIIIAITITIIIPYWKKKSRHKISSAKKFVGKKFRHFAHETLSRNKFVRKKFRHWQKSSSFFCQLPFSR